MFGTVDAATTGLTCVYRAQSTMVVSTQTEEFRLFVQDKTNPNLWKWCETCH